MNRVSFLGGNQAATSRQGLLDSPMQQTGLGTGFSGFSGFNARNQGSQGAQLYQNYVNSLLAKYGQQYGAQQPVFGMSQPQEQQPVRMSWREKQADYGGGSGGM